MADNVLGSLFSDIADAIRSKTGDVATMKPAEFPDNIRAIETGGGSSGGGALPVGIYLSSSDVVLNPSVYIQKRFMYNGRLYTASGNLKSSTTLTYIYRWNGAAWEQVVSVTDCKLDSVSWFGVEYNGNFHMIDNRNHYVFNGETLAKSTSCTNAYSKPFVWQGKLCVYDDSYKAYEWDDDSSTWTQFATLYNATYPLVYNDELYFTNSSAVLKYENGSLTTVASSPERITSNYRVVNGKVYCYYNHSYYTIWYRLNMDTMEYTELGKHPSFRVMRMTENADELSFVGTTYSTNNDYFPFFVIKIVETTE